MVVPRHTLEQPEVQQAVRWGISRLFTLERKLSEELRQFGMQLEFFQTQYLKPLLRKPLASDGSNAEAVTGRRMLDYEKQLTLLVLGKLPRLFQVVAESRDEQEFLYFRMARFMREQVVMLEDFRLQPMASHSEAVARMSLRLSSLEVLLRKIRRLWSVKQPEPEEVEEMKKPLQALEELIEQYEANARELEQLTINTQEELRRREEGGLWVRLGFRQPVKYTLEELKAQEEQIRDECYRGVIRLAKEQRNRIVYVEFEYLQNLNGGVYRHYAFPDGVLGLSQLPRLVQLPEDRSQFKAEQIRHLLNQDVFLSTQEW